MAVLLAVVVFCSVAFAELHTAVGEFKEKIVFPVCRDGLEYTMKVKVDKVYRGNKYSSFAGNFAKTGKSGFEYMAAKVTVTFEEINYIDEAVIGTNDPEIVVHYLAKFDALSCVGEDYGFTSSVFGKDEIDAVLHVGESVTGYLQFEVSKDDPAPILVYKPELDHELYIELR
jgi:hypothetical protein